MKKIVAIILAGLMLLSLTACGGKDDKVVKVGALEGSGMDSMRTEEHLAHKREENKDSSDEKSSL